MAMAFLMAKRVPPSIPGWLLDECSPPSLSLTKSKVESWTHRATINRGLVTGACFVHSTSIPPSGGLEKIIFMIKNIGAEAISRDGGEGGNRLQTTLVSLASPAVLAYTKIDLFIFGQQLDLNSRCWLRCTLDSTLLFRG